MSLAETQPPPARSRSREITGFLLRVGLLTVGLFAAAIVSANVMYGGTWRAIAVLSGRSIVIEPQVIDLGDVPDGETRPFRFTIFNASRTPVTLNELNSSCGCLYQGAKVPLTIEGHRAQELEFSLHASTPQSYEFQITMHFGTESSRRMVKVRARVVERPNAPASGTPKP